MSRTPDSSAVELSSGKLAQIACILEATARKPGNVHRFADFDDLDYLDFLLSASAIAEPLDRAEQEGIGRVVLSAVQATRKVIATNSNLGMILLLAPMAAVARDADLADGLERVLAGATIDDAQLVYEAIRRANPGGMGKVDEQDIADEPTVTLREAMVLAADRDLVARQYANGYREILDDGLPALKRWMDDARPLEIAIIGAYLELLANHPDTLIARKVGWGKAWEASRFSREVLESGWPDDREGQNRFRAFDQWLRSDGNRLNPGATADLTAAVLFVGLRDGTIKLPRSTGPDGWSGTLDAPRRFS